MALTEHETKTNLNLNLNTYLKMKIENLTNMALYERAHVPENSIGKHFRIHDNGETKTYRVMPDRSLIEVNSTKRKKRSVTKRAEYHHKDRRALLKIKIKSIDTEMRIIRLEEQKTPSLSRYIELRDHRKALGQKSRAAQLAMAFIRGKRIHQVENIPTSDKIAAFDRPSDVRRLLSDVDKNVANFAGDQRSGIYAVWRQEVGDFLTKAKMPSESMCRILVTTRDDDMHRSEVAGQMSKM